MDPWQEFTSALLRRGRDFGDIAHCTDKLAVIRALGFSDVLREASIESRWVEMISAGDHSSNSRDIPKVYPQTDSREVPLTIPSSLASNKLIDGIVQSVQHRRFSVKEMRTHILSLPMNVQENYLIYELLHALVGCPGVFLLPEEHMNPHSEPVPDNAIRWEEAHRFSPHEELRPFFYSVVLPVVPIINAYLYIHHRATFILTYNSRVSDLSTVRRVNAGALGLGEALECICTEYIQDVANYTNAVTNTTTIAEVVLYVQRIGQKLCEAMQAVQNIDRNARNAFCIVQYTSTDGVRALLDSLYNYWMTGSGDSLREEVVSYLLAKTSQSYIDFVFQWMRDGMCANEAWESLFFPAAEDERSIFPIESLPSFLKSLESRILSCGQWRNTRRIIQKFVDADAANPSVYVPHHSFFEKPPRFDWRFQRRIEESLATCMHNASTDILNALRGQYSIHTRMIDLHRLLLCVSNDWVGTFVSENFVQLSQPAQRGRHLGWLMERMHRSMHQDHLIHGGHDCMIDNFTFRKDENSFLDRAGHLSLGAAESSSESKDAKVKPLYTYLSLDIPFPELLQQLGFFTPDVRAQYAMIFRLILWVKCNSHMQRIAWRLGLCTHSSHRLKHKMLPPHHLIHHIGIFLLQLDGWIHHTAIPMFGRKLRSQLLEADNIEKLIDTHAQSVTALVDMCFLRHTQQRHSLIAVLHIIQGTLSRCLEYREDSDSYTFSHALFSASTGDTEGSSGADIRKLERQFFDSIRTLISDESKEKAIPSMDFSSFCV